MAQNPRFAPDRPGVVLLPLRAFVGFVFLYAGISKIADSRFLDANSPISIHSTVVAVRAASPLDPLLGPVVNHSFAFGLLMSFAEIAVGLGVLLGLLTRVAAAGGMLLALSLWLTVSWQASPWYTSADLVYLVAFTPLLIAGAGGVLSLDAWLAGARERQPGSGEDRTRRTLLVGAAAVVAGVLAGGASLFRRSPRVTAGQAPAAGVPSSAGAPEGPSVPASGGQSGPVLAKIADVPVGGAAQITDPTTGDVAYVLQLQPGAFTCLDATCPHQGCPVKFVSPADGFTCPCHGSQFDASGKRLSGPARGDLAAIPVRTSGADVLRGSG